MSISWERCKTREVDAGDRIVVVATEDDGLTYIMEDDADIVLGTFPGPMSDGDVVAFVVRYDVLGRGRYVGSISDLRRLIGAASVDDLP